MKEYEDFIHGGAARAIIKVPCECNAYCKPPIHCDVQYGLADWTQEKAERVAGYDNRLLTPSRVVRVVRTYEAARPDRERWFFHGRPEEGDPELSAWLVFWEAL